MAQLQIKLMHREAVARLHDAEILSRSIDRESDSNYLLELLAFELLLKALVLFHSNKYNENHNYQELFEGLPKPVRQRVISEASGFCQAPLPSRRVQELLVIYKNNFVRLRYPFEAYQKMNESEYIAYGNLWVEIGAPVDEAEFQYYPAELYGLTKALRQEVESALADK